MKQRLKLPRIAAALCVPLLQLVLCSVAHAGDSALAQSPALACLTRAADAPALPVYPPELYRLKEGGELNVELEFRGADHAPIVRLERTGLDREFASAVEAFAKHYRVPCMRTGEAPVILKQHYLFVPNDGRKVVPSTPIDSADIARDEQMECVTHVGGPSSPNYPNAALRSNAEEILIAHFRFTAKDQAPDLTWRAPPFNNALRNSIEKYARGLRMPCLKNEPIEMDTMYNFHIEGNPRSVLRDTTLLKLMAATKDYVQPAYFDLTTMACPFDVRLTYRRPYLPNTVRELETSNPARKPLLDWMSTLTLKVDDRANRQVMGDTMTVTIPCGVIDL